MNAVNLFVPGKPVPKGSFKPVRLPDRVWLKPDSSDRLSAWVASIRAQWINSHEQPFGGPVNLQLLFYFARPKCHLRANGDLRPEAPTAKESQPDIDKLCRAVLDALTGFAYADDMQVVGLLSSKCWATAEEPEGLCLMAWWETR